MQRISSEAKPQGKRRCLAAAQANEAVASAAPYRRRSCPMRDTTDPPAPLRKTRYRYFMLGNCCPPPPGCRQDNCNLWWRSDIPPPRPASGDAVRFCRKPFVYSIRYEQRGYHDPAFNHTAGDGSQGPQRCIPVTTVAAPPHSRSSPCAQQRRGCMRSTGIRSLFCGVSPPWDAGQALPQLCAGEGTPRPRIFRPAASTATAPAAAAVNSTARATPWP